MAHNFNNEMLFHAYKNLYGNLYSENIEKKKFLKFLNLFLIFNLKLRIYTVNILRLFLRKLLKYQSYQKIIIAPETSLLKNSEIIKKEISNKGYFFLDNFLNQDFHYSLNKNFPKKHELLKSKSPLKNYNIGFKYVEGERYLDLEKPNAINAFYKFVLSEKFEKEINDIFKLENQKLFCKNIITSIVEEKSFLIPHMDDVSFEKKELSINIIYFIDGNDNDIEYSGGTSIFEDNNAKKILLKPSTLKNSVLIYNNTKSFYHGFKTVNKNGYRKAISCQFMLKSN